MHCNMQGENGTGNFFCDKHESKVLIKMSAKLNWSICWNLDEQISRKSDICWRLKKEKFLNLCEHNFK